MVYLKIKDMLIQKDMTRYELAKRTGIQYHIIDKYYKNNVKRYDSYILNKICQELKCDIADIVGYSSDDTV